ncbi:arylesterase [Desulfovibrio inopinatus]|uniref:arylesterase n=1 Tax=Desulfovibrio inopinatus TaxID=102109 RepID=UPI0004016C24|nr:arylesterase [Desulfovibrio inopinatus]
MRVYHDRFSIPMSPLGAWLAILCLCLLPHTVQAATIVAFGDSLTAGFGLSQDEAFPAVLENTLRNKGYDVTIVNAGISGDTTAGGVSRLSAVLSQKPDGVILELGANDGLRAFDVAFMKDNLHTILSTLQKHDIPTLLVGMYAPRNMGPVYGKQYKAAFSSLAEEFNAAFYPFFLEGVALDPDLVLSDGLHPNAEGVQRIVQRILPTVETFLEKQGVATHQTP